MANYILKNPCRVLSNAKRSQSSVLITNSCLNGPRLSGSFRSQSGSSSNKNNSNLSPNEKLHPIFSVDQSAPLPSFKTDPYPIPLQNPNHPTTRNDPVSSPGFDSEIYHQIDQLKKIDEKHLESYNDHHPTHHSSSNIDQLRSRLVYQSRKRGIVEIELLLSTFIEAQGWLKGWDWSRLTQYSRLLMLPDWDLYYYLVKKQDPPSNSEFYDSELLHQLRIHTSNSSQTVRIMPSLQSWCETIQPFSFSASCLSSFLLIPLVAVLLLFPQQNHPNHITSFHSRPRFHLQPSMYN